MSIVLYRSIHIFKSGKLFADFELLELYVASDTAVTNFKGSYVRDAYRTGLEFQDKEGFNPYRFGLVGASDSHTGIVNI